MENHPRRRAEDREDATPASKQGAEATDRPSPRRRARDFFQRFRQPLIGLGIAGAAAPMVKTTKPHEEATPDASATTPTPAQPQSAAAGKDLEENIANKIAETKGGADREASVIGAMERYGISRDLAEDIFDIAAETGIEPKMAYGLVKTESAFNPRAVSNVGALGLTQVMPRTARWLRPGTRPHELYDRQTNMRLGFRYLGQLIDRYRGDVKLALTAYNRGPGTVDRVLKRGGDPDNGYASKVLGG